MASRSPTTDLFMPNLICHVGMCVHVKADGCFFEASQDNFNPPTHTRAHMESRHCMCAVTFDCTSKSLAAQTGTACVVR